MRRSNKRYINSVLPIVCPILRLAKAVSKTFLYMASELAIYFVIGGVGFALLTLGIRREIAWGLSFAVVALCLVISFLALKQHQHITNRPAKARLNSSLQGEVKFGDLIAQTLLQHAPQEWDEYQDWLHDILLDRHQLLASGRTRWSVTLITYWRLTVLCITVSLIKLRRLVVAAKKRL